MPALHDLQKDFQEYLLGASSSVVSKISDADDMTAAERLQVYGEAYRLRLLEALATDFVALQAYLGADDFAALGEAYIQAYPSAHYSLRYFGQYMARFLAATAPFTATPLLAELAAFDWALTSAFDASDDPLLTIDDVGTVAPADWPNLSFRAHASVIRLDLHWNAPAIWKAAETKQEALPTPEQTEVPVAWLIWRHDLNSYFRSLAVDETYALDALLRGDCFAAICEGLCEWIDPANVAAHAAGFLKQWLADGMLRELTVA
ncbi:MAG: putative DNA-binding domain-containing protein [Gammaproteobacteria bacterium]|nr:putative DNA-binding domain-containing protein [Gammaproteobacteria bacterium]